MDSRNGEISERTDFDIREGISTAADTAQNASLSESLQNVSTEFAENLNEDIVILRREALDLHREILDMRQNVLELRSSYSITNYEDDNNVMIVEPDLDAFDLCEDTNLSEEGFIYVENITDDSQEDTSGSDISSRSPFVQCRICLSSAVHNIPMSTKCGHIFCRSCILISLKFRCTCPVCRKIIILGDLVKLCL